MTQLAFRVNARTNARNRFIDLTSVECGVSRTLPPGAVARCARQPPARRTGRRALHNMVEISKHIACHVIDIHFEPSVLGLIDNL
jgi:hypothetical protein